MTNGGGFIKKPNQAEQPGRDRMGFLADAVEIISKGDENLKQIGRHLELMNQTLQRIAGDVCEIKRQQKAAFNIIGQYCQPMDVADKSETPRYCAGFLADAVEIISKGDENLKQIGRHLELMNQTLQGIAGDVCEINRQQKAAFNIIGQYCQPMDVTDISETPRYCAGEGCKNEIPAGSQAEYCPECLKIIHS